MSRLRTMDEQIAVLNALAQEARARVVNVLLVTSFGDVAYLVAANDPAGRQVTAASDNEFFDIWGWKKNGKQALLKADVSRAEALEALVIDYKEAKIDLILQRVIAEQVVPRSFRKKARAIISKDVYDDAKQLGNSIMAQRDQGGETQH